mmetsp:Transcript_88909/g.238056  ORF Transcript_88909/g.238056 Transcript_88909/m.238056 type:complete len:246 (-) Transcript_88909:203-940(-)
MLLPAESLHTAMDQHWSPLPTEERTAPTARRSTGRPHTLQWLRKSLSTSTAAGVTKARTPLRTPPRTAKLRASPGLCTALRRLARGASHPPHRKWLPHTACYPPRLQHPWTPTGTTCTLRVRARLRRCCPTHKACTAWPARPAGAWGSCSAAGKCTSGPPQPTPPRSAACMTLRGPRWRTCLRPPSRQPPAGRKEPASGTSAPQLWRSFRRSRRSGTAGRSRQHNRLRMRLHTAHRCACQRRRRR